MEENFNIILITSLSFLFIFMILTNIFNEIPSAEEKTSETFIYSIIEAINISNIARMIPSIIISISTVFLIFGLVPDH